MAERGARNSEVVGSNPTGGSSQADKILAYMKAGNTITPRDAFRLFDCLALHSRIAELRGRGIAITCTMKTVGKKHFGEYSL